MSGASGAVMDAVCDKARFVVHAVPDMQTLPRVINYFAQLGMVPTRVEARREGERMAISIEQSGLDTRRAAVIAEKMRSSVLIETVELTAP